MKQTISVFAKQLFQDEPKHETNAANEAKR